MNIFKKLAHKLTKDTEQAFQDRINIYKTGEYAEGGLKGATKKIISNTQKNVEDVLKAFYSKDNDSSIVNKRWKDVESSFDSDSKTQFNLNLATLPFSIAYDIGDRLLLEDVVNLATNTAHSITSTIPYGISVLTGVETETSFNAKNYSTSLGFNNSFYSDNRLEQFLTGARDIGRGLFYGSSNQESGLETGIFGFKSVFEKNASQTIRNTHDWAYGSAVRTFSGFKNLLSPIVVSPAKAFQYIASKDSKLEDSLDPGNSKSFINFSNIKERRDEDGEMKSNWGRFTSIFKNKI